MMVVALALTTHGQRQTSEDGGQHDNEGERSGAERGPPTPARTDLVCLQLAHADGQAIPWVQETVDLLAVRPSIGGARRNHATGQAGPPPHALGWRGGASQDEGRARRSIDVRVPTVGDSIGGTSWHEENALRSQVSLAATGSAFGALAARRSSATVGPWSCTPNCRHSVSGTSSNGRSRIRARQPRCSRSCSASTSRTKPPSHSRCARDRPSWRCGVRPPVPALCGRHRSSLLGVLADRPDALRVAAGPRTTRAHSRPRGRQHPTDPPRLV